MAPLHAAIERALCPPDGANRATLIAAAAAIDESLEADRDVMPLGRLRVLLEDASDPEDPRFQVVLQALATTQHSYRFNDVVPGRPTLFLVQGSDRGPFDTFAPYFEQLANSHNVVFVLLDSFQSTARKAGWLSDQIRDWRGRAGGEGELHILAWSDGTTVVRKAVLDDQEGLFRGARIVNLAPPLAGSYRARWVDDGPMRLIAFPALLYLVRNPYLLDMAEDYNPYGTLMAELYGRGTNDILAEHLGAGAELNVIVEGDPHAPQSPIFDFLEPEFGEYQARYEASLGRNYVLLPSRSENPHQDITRDPDAIRAVVQHFSADHSIPGAGPSYEDEPAARTRPRGEPVHGPA